MKKKKLVSKLLSAVLIFGFILGAYPDGAGAAAKKPLAIYFTYNENINSAGMTVDAVTSASLNGNDTKNKMDNIKRITREIKSKKNAKTFSIQVKEAYPASYGEMTGIAKEQIDKDETVALKTARIKKKIKNSSSIYLGTPIWWYTVPQPVVTFLRSNDFTGKTIYVYGIHEGSGFEDNIERIRELCPGATVVEGITVWGDASNKSVKKKADKWLDKIK